MDFSIGRRISSFFKSRKLALVLIILIIVFSIIGTHVPQSSQLKPEVYNTWKTNHPEQAEIFEKIGFTHLFSSFIFIILGTLLFINTLFCARSMLGAALRRFRNQELQGKTYISGLDNNTVIKTEKEQGDAIKEICSALRSSGYRVLQEENRVLAQKNRVGVFGIFLFHLCILFIILAAVYGSTSRMEGNMQLIEGQAISEEHGNYLFISEGPFFNENHQGFDIALRKFYTDYKDETDTPRGPAGELAIIENGKEVKTGTVYLNQLMSYKGYTFLGNVYGMAPLLIMRNPDGTVYSGSYVTATDTDRSGRYVAYFNIGETGLEGGLMVYMTTNLTSERITGQDAEKTPVMFLKIFDKGKVIYDGTLRLNDTIKVADKYLGFYDMKYWSNFYVVKDDGTDLVYAGIGLMVISLFVSFFIVPKRIWVEVARDEKANGAEVYIGGRADKFRSLYDEEFSGIINKIEERISNGTD